MGNENAVVHAWGPSPTVGQLLHQFFDFIFSLPLFVVTPLLRRWHRHWGASPEEIAARMPGDDLLDDSQYIVTRAIDINAVPSVVWPWIVQIGFGRAGFYSKDLLDNFGHPSSKKIIQDFQELKPGDYIPLVSNVSDTTAFRVSEINSSEHLLLVKPDSTWSLVLKSTPNGTRLISRIRICYSWNKPAGALLALFLNEFGDFAMMKKMLGTLKHNVEGRMLPPY